VKLSVYDLLGREVAVLLNGRKEAGRHEETFDASGLSSGVYVCRLEARNSDHSAGGGSPGGAGGVVLARRMLLVR
jgi:hypothetical protein